MFTENSVPLPWQDTNAHPYNSDADISHLILPSQSIDIIHDVEESSFRDAWRLIAEAQVIYFLGFGFHPKNIERLKLEQAKGRIRATCYGLPKTERLHAAELVYNALKRKSMDKESFMRNFFGNEKHDILGFFHEDENLQWIDV